jgi:Ca-activated chloride channel family protein
MMAKSCEYQITNRAFSLLSDGGQTRQNTQFPGEAGMKATAVVVLVFSALGLGAWAQSTVKADVDVVSIYFTVRNSKGQLVTDLQKEAFKVFENGQQQTLSHFARHTDVPTTLGVLLDVSTSLSRTLGLEADAASHFFTSVMRPNDYGFLISYASRIQTLQGSVDDPAKLAERAQTIRIGGRPDATSADANMPTMQRFPAPGPFPTSAPDLARLRVARLYDAVGFSVDRFLRQEVGRKALVIVALADDAKSESTLRDALRSLKEADVIAYVLEVQHGARAARDDCDIRHIFRNEDENRLARLAVETGGRVIRVEGFEKMQAAFDQISAELHQQYSLGYRPADQNWNGDFRKVLIQSAKGYKISARDGYFATRRNQPDSISR